MIETIGIAMDSSMLFNVEKTAALGTGYGLVPDLVLSSAAWTLI